MKKSLRNHKSIFRIFLVIFALAITAGAFAIIFSLDETKKSYDPNFDKLNSYYDGTQVQITESGTAPAVETITMTAANDANSNNGKVITIENEAELQLFSTKCNSNTAFLGYTYNLIANITCTDGAYFTPVGSSAHKFTGTFDGQGYEIKKMDMFLSSSATYTDQYYAMFPYNNGTITNLGLVDPDLIVQDGSKFAAGGVAFLVGYNEKTVSNCFVVDDGSVVDEEAGIAAFGGARISDFAVYNAEDASLSNCYVVTSIVCNIKIPDYIEFNEIALNNEGSITNCYYLNNSIETFQDNGNQATVTYKSSYNIDSKTGPYFGTRCATDAELITNLDNHNWYVASDYDTSDSNGLDFSAVVGIKYGIMRGVTITGTTITINDEKDYAYMYELFNSSDVMASSKVTYEITHDLNLAKIPVSSYTYKHGIGATIRGVTISGTPTLANKNKSAYPTIYNADVYNSDRVVKSMGVDCYGLFNYVIGEISNLNIVPLDMSFDDVNTTGTTNVKGLGVLAGFIEGGKITNVNVIGDVTGSKNIGEYYLGGICGILGGDGSIKECTVSGTMNISATSNTMPATSSYMGGIAIGGIVGYIESSLGAVYECLNAANITSELGTSTTYAIGGVIGAGYTKDYGTKVVNGEIVPIHTGSLENIGTITVGTASRTYSKLYVAGIIGRHLGITAQVSYLTNNGTINVFPNGYETYVSGVANADILTSAQSNTGLSASQLKNGAGYTVYQASSLTNGANVNITNATAVSNLYYTNVINVKAGNGFVSTLDGLYNVAYNKQYDGTASSKKTTTITAQALSMNTIHTFAPVANVIGGTSTYTTDITSAYNLRDINYTLSSTLSSNLNYAGCVLGEYVNYEDIRNEGNLTFTLNQAVTGNITVSGLFNEVSAGMKTNNLYNAGNINMSYTAIITGNIYASGICYANRNGLTVAEISKYNPSSDDYDKSLVGSINNAINNGEITITSNNFNSITYSTTTVLSPNGQSNLGNTVETILNNAVYVDGNIYTAGITSINEAVITNTFNISNLTAANFSTNTNQANTKEVNVAGISVLNIGQFAYILNCGNDGDIKALNLSSGIYNGNKEKTGEIYIETNAAGISCRNDKLENGSGYNGNSSNPNSRQVISFTINYGSVYSYNYKYNFTSTNMEPSAKSAGILAMGFCNVINVINYGNIYGSETASGIFGIVYFAKFTSEVSTNIYIANTLNYGNVYILERGYNHVHGSEYDDYDWITYSNLIDLTINTAKTYSLTSVVRNTDYISVIGSIFSIVNFGNASNTDYIKIRYLISFDEDIAISGAITAYSATANPDVSSFYSAHMKTNALSGAYETDRYMGKFVQYSPLTSNPFTGTFVTAIDANDNVTTATVTYNGVFSNSFAFMQAIKGNATYLDTTTYKTDIFISDYFEFLGAVYANTILLEKIGWSDITYRAAAEAFATSLDGVAQFVTYVNGLNNKTYINRLLKNALNADTWISKCDDTILLDLTNTLLSSESENENEDIILEMLDYIFTSGSSSYSLISTSTRNTILELILGSDNSLSYSTLLDKLITYTGGYSNLLADSILNTDDAGQYLKNYIDSLSNSNIETILTNYCNYLKDASDNDYFTYKNSEQIRYDLLNAMFEEINDSDFYQKFAEILEIDTAIGSSSISNVIKMYEGYNKLLDQEKIDLYKAIITNNTSTTNLNTLVTYINTMASDIDYYSRMVDLGYSKTSLTNIYNDVSYNVSSTSESVIDERVKLWNQIRNTDIFKTYLSNLVTNIIYDLATEYNNTYQSITEPHNNGAYFGDTADNKLSYIYTTNITPQVYFYGPYINSSGGWFTASDSNLTSDEKDKNKQNLPGVIVNQSHLNVGANTDKYFSVFHSSDESLWTSTELMKSRGGKNSTTTYASALTPTGTTGNATYPTPMLLYYDYNNEQLGGANYPNYTLSSDYYSGEYPDGYEFRGFGGSTSPTGDQQFKYDKDVVDPLIGGTTKYKTNDWTGTLFASNDYYMKVSSTGELFSLNHAVLGRAYNTGGTKTVTLANGSTIKTNNYRFYIQDSDGAYHLVQTGSNNSYDANATIEIGRMVNDTFTPIHTFKNYNGNDVTRKTYSFISYIVGLKMYTSCVSYNMHSTGRTGIYRRSGGWNNYFTWKQSKNTRVFTSQYIDYSVDDLLNLDGYLTEYSDGTYKSNDERNIINRIFNEYLVDDSTQFSKVVAAALLERNMYDASYNVDMAYINKFFTSNIYSTIKFDSNTHPLEYIYQSWTSSTVKTSVMKYLTDLVGNNPNYKTLFIAYCTSNQSAYAKLLLELIKLNADTYDLNTILARGIGSSSDSGAMTIPYVSSYNDVYFVDSSTTINSENMQYGLKFDDITFDLNNAWKKIYIYCKPVNTSGTLTVKIDSDATGTDYPVTSSNYNYIEVTLNNNSSLKLTAHQDIILYKVLVNYNEDETTNQNSSLSFNIRNSTTQNQTNRSVTIPTSADIIQRIESDLTTNSIRYSNVSLTSVSIVIEGYNTYNRGRTLAIGTNTNNIIEDLDFNRNTRQNFTALNSNYLGQTINIYYDSGTLWTTWSQDNSYIISKCDITVNYSYDRTENVTRSYTLLDNASVNTCIQNSFTNEDICNKTLDESTNYSTKYEAMIKNALYGLAPIDYSSILDNPTHSGTASKNIIEILGLSETHNDNLDPEYCVPDFIKLFITSSNTAFKSFIDESVATSVNKQADYEIILRYLVNNLGFYSLNDAINSVTTIDTNSYTTKLTTLSQFRIAAAYIVSDFKYILNNSLSIGTSILKTYIDDAMNSEFQYIGSSTYDYDKFNAFCLEIGYDLSTAGYGIYALASNQGKLNGQFIPDNLDITEMDDCYATETINNVEVLTLNSTPSNEWRGGDSVTKPSVNYAFYKDMKQIEQSISTTVFALDINYGGTTYYGDVNLNNRTITFYVPSIVIGAYNIVNQKYAHNAESNIGSTVSVVSTTNNIVQQTFIVTAENTDVTATYSIIFKTVTIDFNLTYNDTNQTSKTVNASEFVDANGLDQDVTIELKLTSVDGKELPTGLNLEPYISFIGTNTYKPLDTNSYVPLSVMSTDHRVDSDGDAVITVVVSPKLPADEYEITVNILGVSDSVTFEKKASSANSITEVIFEGTTVNFTEDKTIENITYHTAESNILVGRCYDYEELVSYTASNFYLYRFKYSNNATVEVDATKKTDEDTGLMTYSVIYTITSESGAKNYYIHYLKEKDYFDDGSTYASIYGEGDRVITGTPLSEDDKYKYLSGGTLTYSLEDDTYDSVNIKWSIEDDMYAQISYNRGFEPQYRIKYVLDNFYTLGTKVRFAATQATLTDKLTSYDTSYAGMTITVPDENDTGVYYYVYSYTNTGTWSDGEEYTRYYEFPEFRIDRQSSTDAMLKQLTFLEESIVLGNTATVILPDQVLIPDETGATSSYKKTGDNPDILYNTVFSRQNDIVVSSKSITYNNDSDASTYSDYFAIGTVSEADLSFYCPGFKVNDYAEIYQCTTLTKITTYGSDNVQTATDYSILTNHNDLFIYVPFLKNNSTVEIFLVKLDASGNWTQVYDDRYNGTGSPIYTYPTSTESQKYNTKTKVGFTVGSDTYTVYENAGQENNNPSLNMDYYGAPIEGHFWYVSYVIFSEEFLDGGTTQGNHRFFHLSIIDTTNNVQFYVKVYAAPTFTLSDIYITLSENIYDKKTSVYSNTRQISAHAIDTEETFTGTAPVSGRSLSGYKVYELPYNLQALPGGYFYFYTDLLDGYVTKAYTDKSNQLYGNAHEGDEIGSYLPYTSIITQKINLELIIEAGTGEDSTAWAVNTSDVFTRQASFIPTVDKNTNLLLKDGELTMFVKSGATITIAKKSGETGNISYTVTQGGVTSDEKTAQYSFTTTANGYITIQSTNDNATNKTITVTYPSA